MQEVEGPKAPRAYYCVSGWTPHSGDCEPPGVRDLRQPDAVDVHGVDVRIDIAILALREDDLRPVR